MTTGASRISEDRHYSATAAAQQGQTCAGDHGTHVAALAAGYEVGAAKDATVVSGGPQACPYHAACSCGVRPSVHALPPKLACRAGVSTRSEVRELCWEADASLCTAPTMRSH